VNQPSRAALEEQNHGRMPSGPELLAMLEVFSTVDAVFTDHHAFSHPQRELGRVYRSWQKARRLLGQDDFEATEGF
jgi:hypothetical protein